MITLGVAAALGLTACGLQLGRPPAAAVSAGELVILTPEPWLAEAAAAALTELTGAEGPALHVELSAVDARALTVGGGVSAVTVRVALRLDSAPPRRWEGRAEEPYALAADDPLTTEAARAAAAERALRRLLSEGISALTAAESTSAR
ncbi:hypothetical protein L6R49_03350 [Myxococcota bacterium]|nr:hypothetical protein [Myxococcota bacterium]